MSERQYVCIDLKSFYASVECRERGLDPIATNLVVADARRTEKTICLAVSPALKAYGIPGRARLFEVVQRVQEINAARQAAAPQNKLYGSSVNGDELRADPTLAVNFIVAPPRMGLYIDYSSRIHKVYTKYVSPKDIHVYSIDEVFIDITTYLETYGLTARELAVRMIRDVMDATGITATVGIGTNLYLAKVAMDISAKHAEADSDGVRIAELDEMSYRRLLWGHKPLKDFWRMGDGYARRLESIGIKTMGDIARCSLHNEEVLYRLFGVNAELLIDHAWGWEPVTIADIKAYRPVENSLSNGQVLSTPYTFEKSKLIVREMTELLVLDLVNKGLKTDQMTLTVGYDVANIAAPEASRRYTGDVHTDHYGRRVPQQAHGSINLKGYTSSTKQIVDAVMKLYDNIVDKTLLIRRMYVVASHVVTEEQAAVGRQEQMDLFTDYDALQRDRDAETQARDREQSLQKTVLSIHKRYGNNALLKGMNLEQGSTAVERNGQIGGHKK